MTPKTHEENQQKVCVLCLKKTNLQKLSDKAIAHIKASILPDIVAKVWYYPRKICSNCSFMLYGCNSVKDFESKIVLHRYKYDYRVSTRNQELCECEICVAARVTLPNLSNLRNKAVKRGRPAVSEGSKKSRSTKLCTVCLSEIAKGKQHVCTKTQRHNNVLRMVQDGQHQGSSIVATYLREVHNNDGAVSLANIRGRPTRCLVNTVSPGKKGISVDDLYDIKTHCNLSTRNTIKLSSILRGMDIEIPPNVPQSLTQLNQKLKGFYSVTRLPFDCTRDTKEPKTLQKTVIFCNDVAGLIDFVEKERNLSKTDVFYKIGADGGGGSFKITLLIIEKIRASEKKEKDTGVKKLFLLAVIPAIPETYTNIAQVWTNLLQLDQLDAVVAGDLKIINLLLGIMGHSSTFPCPYCITSKPFLAQECSESRTIGTIVENYSDWNKQGADDKKARNFYNCVHKPLVGGSSDSKTVMLCPPPVLHITLGIVNAIYKGIEANDPEVAERWATISACQRHSKFGFTGRNCHKLIANRSVLTSDGRFKNFHTVIDRFADVFKACLQESLEPNFLQKIEEFADSWLKAELPNSSKFHILRFHVPEFCKATKSGLGKYGEQASETVHFDFGITWGTLKVPESSENYDDHLLHSVVLYNSAHI